MTAVLAVNDKLLALASTSILVFLTLQCYLMLNKVLLTLRQAKATRNRFVSVPTADSLKETKTCDSHLSG